MQQASDATLGTCLHFILIFCVALVAAEVIGDLLLRWREWRLGERDEKPLTKVL